MDLNLNEPNIDKIDDDSIYLLIKQIIAFLRQSRAPVNRSIIEKTFHRTLSNDSLLQHWLESHDRIDFRNDTSQYRYPSTATTRKELLECIRKTGAVCIRQDFTNYNIDRDRELIAYTIDNKVYVVKEQGRERKSDLIINRMDTSTVVDPDITTLWTSSQDRTSL